MRRLIFFSFFVVCVDTSSDSELTWFDKKAAMWKSFAFDRVWPMDAMQVYVRADKCLQSLISCFKGGCIY